MATYPPFQQDLTSRAGQVDNPAWRQFFIRLGELVAGGATDAAEYILGSAEASLVNSRVLQGSTTNTISTPAAGQIEVRRAALTGDVTASANSNATTIANDAVTYAKMQNVSAASRLLGRGSASGSGDVEEITLGTNLSMTGTTISASGGGSALLDRVGQLDIVSTSSETTLYSFSVAGGTLSTTHTLHLLMDGDQLNNAGMGNDTVTLKIKYGATTMYSDTALYASNATRISWRMDVRLGNASGTSDQYMSTTFFSSTRGGATTGNGDFNTNGIQFAVLSGTAAEDSTSTLTFEVTIQHSISNAAVSWRRQYASLLQE